MPELLTAAYKQTVIAVLGQEVPDFTAQSITFHHAYKDRCIVEINTTLILKFPLGEEAQKWMGREYWVLEALQGQTSVAVPSPFFIAHQVFCYGYKKVPGILLTDEH